GLAISTRIIHLMDSQLSIESTPEVGSTFSFEVRLPVSTEWAKVTQPGDGEIVGYDGEARTILVIDDRWENRSVLYNLLTPLGFTVIEAADGQQGYEQAELGHPHLIITDLNMPVLDGLTLIQRLRDHSDLKDTPIIASSASVFDVDQGSSLDAGANEFLPKPVQAEALLATLARHLSLTWRYDTTSGTAQPQDDPDILPPVEILNELLELVLRGDLDGMTQAAQQLDSPYHAFSERLVEMADNFEVKSLQALLRQALAQQDAVPS
ncbi:MAG: response regulator, partial [Cyanobacteria bacterium J06632_3]